MRASVRVLLPLLGILALLAWAAATVADLSARRWAERDVSLRARLAASGAREPLAKYLAAGDRRRATSVLEGLARDDRIMGAAACNDERRTLARTPGFPERFTCERLAATSFTAAGWEAGENAEGGPVHVSVLPIEDDGQQLGFAVLVHDMSFLDRRATTTRQFTFAAFGVVALLASVVTILAARFSWNDWTAEMHRLLRVLRLPGLELRTRGAGRFEPLLADVRDLVGELAAQQTAGVGGPWSPDRLRSVLDEHLEGEGVLVVANREPYVHEAGPDGRIRVVHPASGLVTALEPVMRACSGTWIAHGSGSADRQVVDRHDRVRVPPGEESYAIRRVWLDQEEERGYYYGLSNEGLWPLCHVVHARPVFRAGDWRHYQSVNERFAAAVVEEARGDDPIILVQDYHFALLPRLVRRRLPRATVITFWHIPFPSAERLGICPWHDELLEGLLGSSILGFHTQQHCNNFVESVDRYLETRIDRERHSVVLGGRETLVRPYPISVEWPSHWAASAPPAEVCRREVLRELGLPPDTLLGVGVDRLDYTKGLEDRLLAVERLLERSPRLRGRFVFVQLAAPSRTLIERYRALNAAVEELAAGINARFGTEHYRPIVLLRAHHEPPTVFKFYRAADVCYVSSLHDGMNLVAKEFVAARDDLRGVLVLSRFTGAARELTEALLVNPYDLEEASDALAAAVSMPPEEQAERMRSMRALVAEFNVYRWAGRMLVDAARLRRRGRLEGRLAEPLGSADA